MTKPTRPKISTEAIDNLVAAGATAEVVAKIGKRHMPELGPDIDDLIDCGVPMVASFIKAELQVRHGKADRYAARHATHMRQVRSGEKIQGEGRPQKRQSPKRASEPELPLDAEVSQVSQVSQVSRGLTQAHEAHPPVPPPGPSPLSPKNADPDGSAAPSAATQHNCEIMVLDESPRAKLFRIGKDLLVSFGVAEKRTGALIGQWLKAKPDPAGLLAAIQFARDQNVAEPVAYITALINGGSQHEAHRFNSGFGGGFARNAIELEQRASK